MHQIHNHMAAEHAFLVRSVPLRFACRHNSQDDCDEAPRHPWSVSNPRFLGIPAASQPPTSTMHASDAAAPVGHSSAQVCHSSAQVGHSSAQVGHSSAVSYGQANIGPHEAQQMPLEHPPAESSSAIPAMLPGPNDIGEVSATHITRTRCMGHVTEVVRGHSVTVAIKQVSRFCAGSREPVKVLHKALYMREGHVSHLAVVKLRPSLSGLYLVSMFVNAVCLPACLPGML